MPCFWKGQDETVNLELLRWGPQSSSCGLLEISRASYGLIRSGCIQKIGLPNGPPWRKLGLSTCFSILPLWLESSSLLEFVNFVRVLGLGLSLGSVRDHAKRSMLNREEIFGLLVKHNLQEVTANIDLLNELKDGGLTDVPQSTDQYIEPAQHGVQDVLNMSTEVHVFNRTGQTDRAVYWTVPHASGKELWLEPWPDDRSNHELSELSDTTLELDELSELSDTMLELNEQSNTEDGAGSADGRNGPFQPKEKTPLSFLVRLSPSFNPSFVGPVRHIWQRSKSGSIKRSFRSLLCHHSSHPVLLWSSYSFLINPVEYSFLRNG
ncbi:hypothetical protein F2Q70_00011962 [Brassica cretica]|uniref:Uncharacterized protein n=1 Tax=Brassica cretica TaxID=69181 RepID=A0A8S9M1B8_BRACR|nr:hypothetical protein F2Q70_00011962 [Brassica cretica]